MAMIVIIHYIYIYIVLCNVCARYATSTCERYATGVREKIVLAHDVPPGVMTNITRLLRPAVAIDFFPKPSGPARIPGRVPVGLNRIFPPRGFRNNASSRRFSKAIRFRNGPLSLYLLNFILEILYLPISYESTSVIILMQRHLHRRFN